jgi:hypothetical protein
MARLLLLIGGEVIPQIPGMKTPKSILTLSLLAVLGAFPVTSCERREGPAEEAGEAIDDALDQRPGEGLRDAAEDAADELEDAVDDDVD